VTRGTAQDVTEDKIAEARLADAEQRYRTLVEQLPLGTYIRPLDMALPNIYASPQVEPMLGYPAEDWMNDPDMLAAIVHPDDRERVLSEAKRVRGTGEPLRDEYRYLKPDGSVVWVQDETYVVCDEAGEPHCVQGYLLDITERKQAEEERDRLREELHHAQKLEAVGRLAGGVAHDFNNMLTAIRGYAELLVNGLDPESPQHAEAEQIRRAATQASVLPKQLLAFSRKQVLEPKLIDLNHAVSEAMGLIRLLLGDSVELQTDLTARAAAVVADPAQFEQVLLNLATNARDSMPAGGKLTIATRTGEVDAHAAREHDAAPGRYVVLSVSDSGEGMDAVTLRRAFEPFFTTKGAGKGSGLGLASAYGITRQSGGFIKAASVPGHGSTFDVYLPFAVATVTDSVDAEPAAAVAELEPATVLLVEDEELVRAFAATALERAGFRVLTASRATEALEVSERGGSVDVLVSDLMMPGMGGRELAERVVARNPATKVVLMSGFADESSSTDVDGLASTLLQKPFSVPALVDAVRSAVDAPGGERHDPLPPTARRLGITCLVADDHPAVLDSVSRFLETSGIDVVARTGRGDEALAAIEALRPAIALLDVSMEPVNGIEVSRRAAKVAPETGVILYTGHRDANLLGQALEAGARGFVLKEAPLSELTRAMKAVAGGGTFVDAGLSGVLAAPGSVRALSPLTGRERQVLALVADGRTNDAAAAELGISPETVQSHVRNAMAKLEADTRTQAVATALRQQLIA
jgi:PAS domain S-box-containing protein